MWPGTWMCDQTERKRRMAFEFCPLYSGSSGNALYVRYGDTRLLIDAGKSGRMILDALEFIGVDPKQLNAILITHEHSDHIAGAGILARRLQIPVYATTGTWLAMEDKLGKISPENRRFINEGEDFYVGGIGVVPFRIPHDAAEPVGFRLWCGELSLSTATDLGHYTKGVHEAIKGSDLVLLESNHDPDMLRANDHYSSALKRRILGNHGHLSNDACAEAAIQLADTGVRHLILGHLSGENNTPELALQTTELRCELEGMHPGEDICIDLAWRDRVGSLYSIEGHGFPEAECL